MPFGEVCLERKHSEDGATLNMRWMRGVFVCKFDRTDEMLLLTPTGAVKTRCLRRLEGDNAWDLQCLNLCVGSPWNATARSTQQGPATNKMMSWQAATVRKCCICDGTYLDKYGRTPGCPGCVGIGQHTEVCRARFEQEMVDEGDAIKLETSGNQDEIVQKPDVSLKRKIGEPHINPGGASSCSRPRELRDDLFARTPDTRFSSSICWPRLRVARISYYSSWTSVLHLCTLA